MKTLLLGSTILSFILFFSNDSNSQELAKPIPNKVAQKQASVKKTETNSNSNQTISGNKSDSENLEFATSRIEKESSASVKATKDADDYQQMKIKWIAENPEKYKSLSSNPNLVIMTEEELNKLPSEERNKILLDQENYLIIK